MQEKAGLREILSEFVPHPAVDQLAEWILEYRIKVDITRSRLTKAGDYRYPSNGSGHRISINHDLNKYHFLITFVHEVAHLTSGIKHKNKRLAPHGKEWKNEFKLLIQPFMNSTVFPDEILEALAHYFKNPAATSCTDVKLTRVLSKYDAVQTIFLEDLPADTVFSLKNGKKFIKGKKMKKLYQCVECSTRHMYHVHPLAEVYPDNQSVTQNSFN